MDPNHTWTKDELHASIGRLVHKNVTLKLALMEAIAQLEINEDIRKRDDGTWYWTQTGETLIHDSDVNQ